jgi:aminoglycoside/choline kinase family phosphotransferase
VHALYREACALVPVLQRVPASDAVPSFARRLDESLFAYKAGQVVEWVLPLAGAARRGELVREAFALVAREALAAPQRLAHRDYKAANLHVVRDASGREGLVMLDVQGAFLAPPEYDLVCLLRDSHVELEESFVQSALEEIRPALPDAPDPESFRRRFTLLTLTRNGKDLARYVYAARVRDDARYVPLLPRAISTLKAASALARDWDPRLDRLAELIAALPDTPCVP